MKIEKYKKTMIEILLIEIIGILIGFMFILKPKAETVTSTPTISYRSPETLVIFNRELNYGNYYWGVNINPVGTAYDYNRNFNYMLIDYTYRMQQTNKRYNIYFTLMSSGGLKPVVLLNNKVCEVYDSSYNTASTTGNIWTGIVNNVVYGVACVDIDPNPNTFTIQIRGLWFNDSTNYVKIGVRDSFFVQTYTSSNDAVTGAIQDIGTQITQNQTQNTNRIVSSVESMTNTLINKQNEWQNTDLDENTKQNANTGEYTNAIQSQNNIIDSIGTIDEQQIQIALNPSTSNWIWETLTRLIQSHTLVFSLFISVLSVGVIKLILRR